MLLAMFALFGVFGTYNTSAIGGTPWTYSLHGETSAVQQGYAMLNNFFPITLLVVLVGVWWVAARAKRLIVQAAIVGVRYIVF